MDMIKFKPLSSLSMLLYILCSFMFTPLAHANTSTKTDVFKRIGFSGNHSRTIALVKMVV
jgi:hypothetical protein